MIRASITLDGRDERSSVKALKMNKMNIERKIQTANPPGPDDPITALTKPCSVSGKPSTNTRKFMPLSPRRYIKASTTAKMRELDLKKI